MQAPLSGQPNQLRNVGYFMIAPMTAVILLIIALLVFYVNYNSQHNGRIFPGISIMGVDVSDMSPEEAQQALGDAFPYAHNAQIVSPILLHSSLVFGGLKGRVRAMPPNTSES